MKLRLLQACFLVAMLCTNGAAFAKDTVVDDATLSSVGDGSNWPAFGHDYSEQRFSPLKQINTETVPVLGLNG